MLKLSKQDLTDIMPGKKLPDAIRLFNALNPRSVYLLDGRNYFNSNALLLNF